MLTLSFQYIDPIVLALCLVISLIDTVRSVRPAETKKPEGTGSGNAAETGTNSSTSNPDIYYSGIF
ncbi:hypothetical protein [Larkinella soli]|uniref:hypothetical protein n=1 Tax=Larkinella soli TaxID=1770527 RepID=UPI000FFC61CE|nr:hypothetical protein [Larkinella soli]